MPSQPVPAVEALGLGALDPVLGRNDRWTTGSSRSVWPWIGSGGFSRSSSRSCGTGFCGFMLRSGGETSFLYDLPLMNLPLACCGGWGTVPPCEALLTPLGADGPGAALRPNPLPATVTIARDKITMPASMTFRRDFLNM